MLFSIPETPNPHLQFVLWLKPTYRIRATHSGPCIMWTIQQHSSIVPASVFSLGFQISLSVVCYDTLSLFWQFRVKIAIISSLMIPFAETESALHTGQWQRPTPPNTQNSRTLVVTWRDPPIYYICNREKTIEKSTVCPRCQVTKKLPILWSQTKTHLYWITLDHLP